MTADDIILASRQCIGTPFRHQGRMVGIGLDCAGVAVHVAEQLGCGVVDVNGYGRTPINGQLEITLGSQPFLHQVDNRDSQPGDILLMRFAGEPQHLAILAYGTIIHAYESVGMCCEHALSSKWAARVVSTYRFVGLS
jgi:cell wall-associated NlpC family hydrolase